MKRALDILFALLILAVLWPGLLLLAGAVALALGRPVWFVQERIGKAGRPFRLIKFRTLRPARPGERPGVDDALRMGRVGGWLRNTGLDELPELWNILKGDMSFVGPRPLLPEYLPRYSDEQARRHEVRPGLTGWAQVHGATATTWRERFALDVWYVDHRTLGLDAWILVLTVGEVFRKNRGVRSMPPFQGND